MNLTEKYVSSSYLARYALCVGDDSIIERDYLKLGGYVCGFVISFSHVHDTSSISYVDLAKASIVNIAKMNRKLKSQGQETSSSCHADQDR